MQVAKLNEDKGENEGGMDGHVQNMEEETERKRTRAEIRGDSHSVLTENSRRRGLLIKRYW